MNYIDELRQNVELLDRKILYFKRQKITQTDASQLFQIDIEIENSEKERDQIKQEIESINYENNSQKLYCALLKLGYRDQNRAFQKFVRSQSIGAFLIHGSPDYGQRWLLNRLVTQNFDSANTEKIIIGLQRIGRRTDISTLWGELRQRCRLRIQSTVTEIIDRVYQGWQTRNVILIFHNVHFMPENYLQQLINEFWLPLATQARDTALSMQKYKLLMLLIDYEGCVGTREKLFVEKIDATWEAKIPVKLPAINPFGQHELNDWLEIVYDDFQELPLAELISQNDELAQEILDNSNNGIPEQAFPVICDRCECYWSDIEDRWLTL